jgi:signal transduction histidine kinase
VIIQLDTSVEALRDEELEAAAKHIRRARELARESLAEARRSVHALRPQALEKADFADALKAIITNTRALPSGVIFNLRASPASYNHLSRKTCFTSGRKL